MDKQFRILERAVVSGDYAARRAWKKALARIGLPDPDQAELEAPLTEWEETQDYYDDLWWHAKRGYRCGLWGSNGNHDFWDVDFAPSLYKAHHDWGHRNWGNRNSKRKTLKTHRDGSRKNHRLRGEAPTRREGPEASHERRRKKRFGGKQHIKQDLVRDAATGRYRWVWTITEPDMDA